MGELTVLEKAICRAVLGLFSLIIFVLFISIWNLQTQIDSLKFELQEQQQKTEQEMKQEIKELDHKVDVYKNLCDTVISGRSGEW